MNKGIKKILLVALMALIVATTVFGMNIFKALRTFAIEEQIHGTYYPVFIAIEHFTETNGFPPKTLDQLIPAYLISIPTSPYVYKLDYQHTYLSNWIMNAHSRVLEPARIYSWRSEWRFTEMENKMLLKEFHNIVVFKE